MFINVNFKKLEVLNWKSIKQNSKSHSTEVPVKPADVPGIRELFLYTCRQWFVKLQNLRKFGLQKPHQCNSLHYQIKNQKMEYNWITHSGKITISNNNILLILFLSSST